MCRSTVTIFFLVDTCTEEEGELLQLALAERTEYKVNQILFRLPSFRPFPFHVSLPS